MPIIPAMNGVVMDMPPVQAQPENDINVTVRVKKNPHIDVEIDIDQLSYKEMKRLRKLASEQGEDEAMDEVIAVLSKLTGQDLSSAPVRVVNAIMAQLGKLNNPNA